MVQGARPQRQVLDGHQGRRMKLDRDEWLSGIFGYDVFKIGIVNDESIDPQAIFSRLPSVGRSFCYAKVPVAQVGQVGALTSAGLRVVDVNVTFERQPSPLN